MNKLCISTVNKLSFKSVNCPPLMTFWFPSGNNRLSQSNFAVSKIYRKTLVYFLQNLHFLKTVQLQNINVVSVNNVPQHCLFFQLVTSNTFSSTPWIYYSNLQFCLIYYAYKAVLELCLWVHFLLSENKIVFLEFSCTHRETEWTNDRYGKGICHKRRRKKRMKGM
jgi:hypothetical protein